MDLVYDPRTGKMVDFQTGLPVDGMAPGNVAPQRVNFMDRLLAGSGVSERIMAAHQLFNPVTALAEAGQQSQVMFDPATTPMGRVAALGGMLTGMAGTVAPMYAASRGAVPTTNAMVDALTGINMPGGEFLADEFGGVNLNAREWYHGTPDSRGVKAAGGFTDPNRSVYMSDTYKVADTYADDVRAFDYQNATPEVLKVKASPQKVVDIDAGGATFKGIDAGAAKRGMLAAGAPEAAVDDMIAKRIRSDGKISTHTLEAMLKEFGFDGADIANVRDTYMFAEKGPKSTVRIVMDPSKVELVKKYGIAGAAAMLGVTAMDVEAAMAGAP